MSLKDLKREDDGLDKSARKAEIKRLQDELSAMQMRLRDAKLPVIVLVEGWSGAGKGSLINKLIEELDPRFCSDFSADRALEHADRYPFLYPFFTAIPENGKLLFMDSGWMESCVRDLVLERIDEEEYARRLAEVNDFERQLRDNGYLVIKLFLHISEKEQRKRLDGLCADRDTAWRVTDSDWAQNRAYKRFRKAYDSFMESNADTFPWTVLDSSSHSVCVHDAFAVINAAINAALAAGKVNGAPCERSFPMTETPVLADCDLTLSLTDEEYKAELKKYQKKLKQLHNVIYRKRIPVVVCYEGWDAAGKGGNIRRLAAPLDPRGFDVYPIASPEPHELARHYLWRFWNRLPRTGHIAIFDRTWYGRVMVERLEGYCTENDWRRAYTEINEFEQELSDWGAVVLKFWIQIDPDTQLQRFTDRQNTPEKQWKITEEDWRNREKWPQYEEAIGEMLAKTSTEYAPWHIIESVDKKYARIKVLRIVTEALEKAIGEKKL